MQGMKTTAMLLALLAAAVPARGRNEISHETHDGYNLVIQTEGPTLGYSPASGVKIIERDGYAFKSYDGRDTLLPYADWRLSAEERARDLAGRLSMDEIAGLMLYSPQNHIPNKWDTYDGRRFEDTAHNPWDLSDGQLRYLADENVRHVLVSGVSSPADAARWNNTVQAYVEGRGHGIPANNSSDPRHSAFHDAEFAPGAAGQLSLWSNGMGMAATFDPATVREFAEIMRDEYRALGIATALSPQADLGTDPRWFRFSGTYGNDPQLTADLVREYIDALQSSPGDSTGGWGSGSVNAMVKHWPGGGTGEAGRDAHLATGKFAVYPGGHYDEHKIPFIRGAFALPGATAMASAVMPYYTISYGHSPEAVGNSFSHDMISRQLRDECGYDGVVCTDWAITADAPAPERNLGKPWGVEELSVARRHYKALMAGVDQFGGNYEKGPVLEAYAMGCAEIGREAMDSRMRESARRLLLNMFRPGLFENAYVDAERTAGLVGNPEWMDRGYRQQLRSVVMLKNSRGTLPLAGKLRVYVPERHVPELWNIWGGTDPARHYRPVPRELGDKYFELVSTPDSADVAIVFMESPNSYGLGYDPRDAAAGGNGYIPITLQYRPYTATAARPHSLLADEYDPGRDRSYLGKTARAQNECDLDLLEATRRAMGAKPVIAVIDMANPMVMSETEPLADAILVGFSVQTQAYLDLISGRAEPSALLPFELPASMDAVERHLEDAPHDIEPYRDADGNLYRFAFGLDFSGPISDSRTARYSHE